MFPTFESITREQPRLVILLGLGLFCFGFYLMFVPSDEPAVIQQTQHEEEKQAFDTRSLLVPPEREATADYETKVMQLAVARDTLTISENCAMDPLILKLRVSATLNVENTDTVEHTIAFEDQNFFNVSPGQTRKINFAENFGKGAGIYRYRCNDLSLENNVGVLYLTE